jgi:ABC-2 type transport system permease protein
MILFSTVAVSNTGVYIGTGGVVLVSYIFGLIPKINKYFPTFLTDGNSLIYGIYDVEVYTPSIIITSAACVLLLALCIPIFNKKQL